MNPILFLDFDGVTHPIPGWDDESFCKLHLIEAVLRDYPNVEVVISSSWRDHFKLHELQEFFSADIAGRVVGVTPSIKSPSPDWLPGYVPVFERQWEIESWMKTNRTWGTPWLAIDDRDWWFSPDCSNLLLVEALRGFTTENAEELRRMLRDKQAAQQ